MTPVALTTKVQAILYESKEPEPEPLDHLRLEFESALYQLTGGLGWSGAPRSRLIAYLAKIDVLRSRLAKERLEVTHEVTTRSEGAKGCPDIPPAAGSPAPGHSTADAMKVAVEAVAAVAAKAFEDGERSARAEMAPLVAFCRQLGRDRMGAGDFYAIPRSYVDEVGRVLERIGER